MGRQGSGNMLVIRGARENNHLDVIKKADHVIDLGPEGGHTGGEVVATGTPEDIAAWRTSHGSLSQVAVEEKMTSDSSRLKVRVSA